MGDVYEGGGKGGGEEVCGVEKDMEGTEEAAAVQEAEA